VIRTLSRDRLPLPSGRPDGCWSMRKAGRATPCALNSLTAHPCAGAHAFFSEFFKNFYNTDLLLGKRISEQAVQASWNIAEEVNTELLSFLAGKPARRRRKLRRQTRPPRTGDSLRFDDKVQTAFFGGRPLAQIYSAGSGNPTFPLRADSAEWEVCGVPEKWRPPVWVAPVRQLPREGFGLRWSAGYWLAATTVLVYTSYGPRVSSDQRRERTVARPRTSAQRAADGRSWERAPRPH
jgi:hypothetical protein